MKHFSRHTLENMPERNRAQFVNSLSGFKSANLVGTIDNNNLTNIAIISSVVHLGSAPAIIGFVMRPPSVDRHTLENIKHTKQYTLNHVNINIWQSAHQTSARYNKAECEFEKTGLTKEFLADTKAPFVKESQLKYALELKQIMPITVNNTLFIIGEITDVYCQQDAIKSDGYIDLESINSIAISGLDSYHTSQRLSRLSYAKPNQVLKRMSLDGDVATQNFTMKRAP